MIFQLIVVWYLGFGLDVTFGSNSTSNVTCDTNPSIENIDDRSTACAFKVRLKISIDFFFQTKRSPEISGIRRDVYVLL